MEKQIEQILRSVRTIGPYHAGAGEAARLIATWLREGVVWESSAVVKHEWRWEEGEHIVNSGLRFDEIGPGWLLNMPDGQRVRVTLRLEGEDADKGMD